MLDDGIQRLKDNIYLSIGVLINFIFEAAIFIRFIRKDDIRFLWHTFWPYLILILGGAQTRFFTLIPQNPDHYIFEFMRINPVAQWIPLFYEKFHLRTHVYFISQHLNFMIIWWFFWRLISRVDSIHWLIRSLPFLCLWGFWLEVVDLIDYMIIYNEHFTILFGWEVQYNDFKLFTLSIIIFITWVKSLRWSLLR